MSPRTRNLLFGMVVTLVALGGISVVFLLSSSPSQTIYSGTGIDENGEPLEDGWVYSEDGEVRCASVLSGPLNDPDELSEQREEADLSDDVHVENDLAYDTVSENAWVVADCNRLRQQRLGWAVLIGIPTLMLFTLAVFGRPGMRGPDRRG